MLKFNISYDKMSHEIINRIDNEKAVYTAE